MSSTPRMQDDVREKIISEPEFILEDQDVMRALIAANERSMGGNIVDLRGIAMERLEARLWPAPTRSTVPFCACSIRWNSRVF